MTSSPFSHFILFGISYLCICFMPYFSYKCLNMIDYIHFLVYMIYYSLNIYLYIFYYYIILCARNIQTIIYPHYHILYICWYIVLFIYIIFSHLYYLWCYIFILSPVRTIIPILFSLCIWIIYIKFDLIIIHYFLYMNECSFFIYIYVCSIKHIILLY